MIMTFRSHRYRGGSYMTTGGHFTSTFANVAASVIATFWCALTGNSAETGGGTIGL